MAQDERLPSTQIREMINTNQSNNRNLSEISRERWENDPIYYRIEAKLDEIDRKLYNEELRYAKFMASRHELYNMIPQKDFQEVNNLASMSIVHYDPNFDFGSRSHYQGYRTIYNCQ